MPQCTSNLQTRGIFCNPTASYDAPGSFHDLGEYNDHGIDVHSVDDTDNASYLDEEQGFEAVLDVTNLGRGLWDFDDLAESASASDMAAGESSNPQHGPLYQGEQLESIMKDKTLNSTIRRDVIFRALEVMGIKTFIVVSGQEDDTLEILQRVRDVIDFVAFLKRSHSATLKCCLLFQDTDGLLYNLCVSQEASGPYNQFQSNLHEFSGIQATATLAILVRIFPCITSGQLDQSNPAFLALVLCLLFTEETTLSWLNSNLFVQGIPSTASYLLKNRSKNDWIYKSILCCLIFSGAASSDMRRFLLLVGTALACLALLANLGSRVWHFLRWSPISICGPMAPLFSFLGAVSTGILFPHMGHRDIACSAKVAVESVIKNAFFSCAIFALTALETVQRFLLAGTVGCSQNLVNIVVGSWILATLLLNLFLAAAKPQPKKSEEHKNLLLFDDQYSPVGYRVPTFPVFVINPSQGKKGIPLIELDHELVGSVLLALLLMASIISMSFTGWHKNLESRISDWINGSF